MANVTEIHHGTELMESINEVNDVDAKVNGSATNETLPKETLTLIPSNSLFMFHKDFFSSQESHCQMQNCQMSPNNT